VLRESLDYYRALRETALARVANGRGSSVDVYRIQLRRRALERQLDELANEAARHTVTINTLLNRAPSTDVNTNPVSPERVAAIPIATRGRVTELQGLDDYPSLRVFALRQAIAERAIAVNELDARPDFGVGLDYIAVGQRQDMDVPRNGRDVILPRAMVTVPLSRGRYSAREEEERLRIRALDAEREALRNQLVGTLNQALLRIEDAADELAFLDEQLETLATAIELTRTQYANPTATSARPFDELLELETQSVELRTRAVGATVTLLSQEALLDRYLLNE
jgi:outer membrane protein TolC